MGAIQGRNRGHGPAPTGDWQCVGAPHGAIKGRDRGHGPAPTRRDYRGDKFCLCEAA